MNWIEKENFWILNVRQRSKEWYRARYGRCTSSLFSACIGEDCYLTPDLALKQIKQEVIIQPTFAMQRGIRLEPIARSIYEKNFRVKVEEIGLAIPKWNLNLAASTDGLVGNEGIIEIKCPVRYYKSLELLRNNKNFRELINPAHYLQMQGGMAILERQWCDYIIYYEELKKIFIYRIPFDREYWNEKYKFLKQFIEKSQLDKLDILLPTTN
jgi:putative phage-type endonuclease